MTLLKMLSLNSLLKIDESSDLLDFIRIMLDLTPGVEGYQEPKSVAGKVVRSVKAEHAGSSALLPPASTRNVQLPNSE